MPVIVRDARLAEARAARRHAMRVVETDQPVALRVVQRQGISQAVRAFRRWVRSPDFEFYPIASLELVNTSIEAQQELERVFA